MSKKKKQETRINIDELARILDVSRTTLTTWMGSYKFSRYIKYDYSVNDTKQLNVLITEKFCKQFITFLAHKGLNKRNYVKSFCDGMEELKCAYW